MGAIPGLDELLAALRAEGVPVGPVEVVRIQHALATTPRLDRDGLRRFLACLLVKRSEPKFVIYRINANQISLLNFSMALHL